MVQNINDASSFAATLSSPVIALVNLAFKMFEQGNSAPLGISAVLLNSALL
jgi:hypothetical protein